MGEVKVQNTPCDLHEGSACAPFLPSLTRAFLHVMDSDPVPLAIRRQTPFQDFLFTTIFI